MENPTDIEGYGLYFVELKYIDKRSGYVVAKSAKEAGELAREDPDAMRVFTVDDEPDVATQQVYDIESVDEYWRDIETVGAWDDTPFYGKTTTEVLEMLRPEPPFVDTATIPLFEQP